MTLALPLYPHPTRWFLSLGFGLPLSSPQSHASLLVLPSSTHLSLLQVQRGHQWGAMGS